MGQQQYSPNSIGAVMYWTDLGLGGDPFYKVEVVGWYVVRRASLGTVRGWDRLSEVVLGMSLFVGYGGGLKG